LTTNFEHNQKIILVKYAYLSGLDFIFSPLAAGSGLFLFGLRLYSPAAARTILWLVRAFSSIATEGFCYFWPTCSVVGPAPLFAKTRCRVFLIHHVVYLLHDVLARRYSSLRGGLFLIF